MNEKSMTPMDLSAEVDFTPAFHDLDPMNIVWHGHYVKYLEMGRSAVLSKYRYDYLEMRDSGYAYPVVDMRIKYIRSIEFGQRVSIRAEITEWENRLRIDYVMRDAKSRAKLNQAHTIQVAVDMSTKEMCFVSPAILFERLGLKAP